MIIDFRRGEAVHSPLFINGQQVERVSSFKFLGTTICDDLKWEENTGHISSKAHQRLHSLRQLRKFRVSREGMLSFYRATIESILTFSVTVWYGNTTVHDKAQLERVVRTASKIIGCERPSVASLYATRIKREGEKVMGDPSHPAYSFFKPLPSGKRLQSLKCRTSRFKNSTYPEAVRHLNSSPKAQALCARRSALAL